MKKFVFVIAIILSCCMFFGCGQRLPSSNEFILLSVSTSADGQVTQSLNFSLGSKKLENAGATTLDVANVKNALISNVKLFRDEFYINFILVYNAANSENKEDFQIGKALTITDVTYNELSDSVGFNMVFSSSEVWNFYHPKQEGSDNGASIEYGYIITSSSKGLFPFASEVNVSGNKTTVGQRYMDAYENALSASGVNVEYKPDLVYDYGTTQSRIRSDSEYYFTDASGVKHHVWLRNSEEYIENNSIELYIIQAHRGLWYATALGGVLLAVGIAIIVIKVRDKKQPK